MLSTTLVRVSFTPGYAHQTVRFPFMWVKRFLRAGEQRTRPNQTHLISTAGLVNMPEASNKQTICNLRIFEVAL